MVDDASMLSSYIIAHTHTHVHKLQCDNVWHLRSLQEPLAVDKKNVSAIVSVCQVREWLPETHPEFHLTNLQNESVFHCDSSSLAEIQALPCPWSHSGANLVLGITLNQRPALIARNENVHLGHYSVARGNSIPSSSLLYHSISLIW